MPEVFGFDAYSPAEIARRVETVGEAKARALSAQGLTIEGQAFLP